MEPYFFSGVVMPERAQLSLQITLGFTHVASGISGTAKISIVLNQIAVWIESEHDWDIFDLRNIVKNIIQNHLAMVGYLKGYAYDFEITRVLNQSREIDYVFGIDIPCIASRNDIIDLQDTLLKLREKTIGPNGMLLNRCFSDLVSAMKHADDTGFYCYRAIESLRHHCAAVHSLPADNKSTQWAKLREVSGSDEQTIRAIKAAADPLRHGETHTADSENRASLLTSTWNIVDGYLKNA
ncbi:hypothetical protein ACK25U_17150 [Ectopseudomonas mendocina]